MPIHIDDMQRPVNLMLCCHSLTTCFGYSYFTCVFEICGMSHIWALLDTCSDLCL